MLGYIASHPGPGVLGRPQGAGAGTSRRGAGVRLAHTQEALSKLRPRKPSKLFVLSLTPFTDLSSLE
jgi:hypothetical protein